MMNGPVRGTCSTPSIRASNRRRPSPPAMIAPGCQNQLRTDLLQALDDRLDTGVDVELAGIEDERVRRNAQRRHGPLRVRRVPASDLLEVLVRPLRRPHLPGATS